MSLKIVLKKKHLKILVAILACLGLFIGGFEYGTFQAIAGYIGSLTEVYTLPPYSPYSYTIGQYNSTHYYLQNNTGYGLSQYKGYEYMSSNSTAVLAQSIHANTSVFVKEGQFSLNNLLTVGVDGYHLIGEGWGSQINVGANGGFNLTSSSSFRDFMVSNIHFDGGGAATRAITSVMPTGQKRIQDSTISNNWFWNFQTSGAVVLKLENLETSKIIYNNFYRVGDTQLLLTSNDYDTGNVQVFGNYFFFGYDYANENAIGLLTRSYTTKGSIFETWITQNQFYSPKPSGGGKDRPLAINLTTSAGAIETVHIDNNRFEANQALWTSDNSTYKVRKISFTNNYLWTDSTQSNMKEINLDADTRSSFFTGNHFQIESSTSYTFLSNRTDADYNNVFANNELYSSASPTFSPGRKTIVQNNVGLKSLYTVKVNGTNNIVVGSDLANFGATGAMAQKTKYTIENYDVYLTVSGGTVTNIIIYDPNGTQYADLGSSCTAIRIPVLWILNVTYSAKPTVTLLWVS